MTGVSGKDGAGWIDAVPGLHMVSRRGPSEMGRVEEGRTVEVMGSARDVGERGVGFSEVVRCTSVQGKECGRWERSSMEGMEISWGGAFKAVPGEGARLEGNSGSRTQAAEVPFEEVVAMDVVVGESRALVPVGESRIAVFQAGQSLSVVEKLGRDGGGEEREKEVRAMNYFSCRSFYGPGYGVPGSSKKPGVRRREQKGVLALLPSLGRSWTREPDAEEEVQQVQVSQQHSHRGDEALIERRPASGGIEKETPGSAAKSSMEGIHAEMRLPRATPSPFLDVSRAPSSGEFRNSQTQLSSSASRHRQTDRSVEEEVAVRGVLGRSKGFPYRHRTSAEPEEENLVKEESGETPTRDWVDGTTRTDPKREMEGTEGTAGKTSVHMFSFWPPPAEGSSSRCSFKEHGEHEPRAPSSSTALAGNGCVERTSSTPSKILLSAVSSSHLQEEWNGGSSSTTATSTSASLGLSFGKKHGTAYTGIPLFPWNRSTHEHLAEEKIGGGRQHEKEASGEYQRQTSCKGLCGLSFLDGSFGLPEKTGESIASSSEGAPYALSLSQKRIRERYKEGMDQESKSYTHVSASRSRGISEEENKEEKPEPSMGGECMPLENEGPINHHEPLHHLLTPPNPTSEKWRLYHSIDVPDLYRIQDDHCRSFTNDSYPNTVSVGEGLRGKRVGAIRSMPTGLSRWRENPAEEALSEEEADEAPPRRATTAGGLQKGNLPKVIKKVPSGANFDLDSGEYKYILKKGVQ